MSKFFFKPPPGKPELLKLRPRQQPHQSTPRLDLVDFQVLDWLRGRGKDVSPKDRSGVDWGARILVAKPAALRAHQVNKAQESALQTSNPKGIPTCLEEGKCPAGISNPHPQDGRNPKVNRLDLDSKTPTRRGFKTCS